MLPGTRRRQRMRSDSCASQVSVGSAGTGSRARRPASEPAVSGVAMPELSSRSRPASMRRPICCDKERPSRLARAPAASLGSYVISMAGAPSDVLAVQLLLKECGLQRPMRVVPLRSKFTAAMSVP